MSRVRNHRERAQRHLESFMGLLYPRNRTANPGAGDPVLSRG
jgi:hypothetical protein